jgi:tetratricopeptide (TPR) repeat protein
LDALVLQAWIAHVRGYGVMAGAVFCWAELLERDLHPELPHLAHGDGRWYAEYLLRNGQISLARRVVESNLMLAQDTHRREEQCWYYRLLAEVECADGQHEEAYQHYQEALKIARSLPVGQQSLIEALLALGLWASRGIGSSDVAEGDEDKDQEFAQHEQRQRIAALLAAKHAVVPQEDGLAEDEDADKAQQASGAREWQRRTEKSGRSSRCFTVAQVGTRARTRGRPLRVGQEDASAMRQWETRGNTGGGWIKLVDGISEFLPFRPERTLVNQIKDRLAGQAPRTGAGDEAMVDETSAVWDSRGRFALEQQKAGKREGVSALQVARDVLEEALRRAISGGYRVHEADIRVALARVYLAVGDRESARREAEYARGVSEQCMYFWGQVDAGAVLEDL